jgi:hypothetical protein
MVEAGAGELSAEAYCGSKGQGKSDSHMVTAVLESTVFTNPV